MKNIHYKIILPTIAIAYCFFGCTPEPQKTTLSQDEKDWCVFQKGSYWIYKNDSTGETDSLYVTSSEISKKSYASDNKVKYIYEEYSADIRNIHQTTSIYISIVSGEGRLDYSEDNQKLHNFINGATLLIFNQDGSHDNNNNNILINGIKYTNINKENTDIVLVNDSIRGTKKSQATFWVAKNQGIIKKVIQFEQETESWSLLRNHIIQ